MKEFSLTFSGSSPALRVLAARSIIERTKGLMFTKNCNKALLLVNCNCIHTFFMRFPIDALFLDGDNRLVKVMRAVKPFRLSRGGK